MNHDIKVPRKLIEVVLSLDDINISAGRNLEKLARDLCPQGKRI
jgi:hypothetical protein